MWYKVLPTAPYLPACRLPTAPDEGGETAFPMSNGWLHPHMGEAAQGPFSECAKGHVAYKPKSGDALMFYDRDPTYLHEGRGDEGCEV